MLELHKSIKKAGVCIIACITTYIIACSGAFAASSDEIMDEISGYEDELKDAETQIEELDAKISEAEANVAESEASMAALEEEIDGYKASMSERIRYFYEEESGTSLFTALLTSRSLAEALRTVELQAEMHRYDAEKLDEFNSLVEEEEKAKEEAEAEARELTDLVKTQRLLAEELEGTIEAKNEELGEALEREEEERQNAAAAAAAAQNPSGSSAMASTQSIGAFEGYSLSESELRGITALCEQEQGVSAEGVATEASLIANKYQINGKSYGSLWDYVNNSGWWYKASYYTSQSPRSESNVEVVRDIICNGNRTLPANIDEHDCISDISSASNNGNYFDPSDRSQYISGVTVLHNRYGSTYTFYCFSHDGGDPFGYTRS